MRSLSEIVEAVLGNQPVDTAELRYAVAAMSALMAFDRRSLLCLVEAEQLGSKPVLTRSAEWQCKEHLRRHRSAGEKPPRDWLGWNNDPANPEYQQRRTRSIALVAKMTKGTSE